MAYRHDSSLEFLQHLQSEDLNDLVYCLTHDKDGKARFNESLTSSVDYSNYYPDHNKYWKDIAEEIQVYGANTFATIFRGGQGVEYREVLSDVCDKIKVNYNKSASVELIENNLLMTILTNALDRMSTEELKELAQEVGVKNRDSLTSEALLASFQVIFRMGGFKSYQLTVIIANAILKALIGRGISFAGNAALTKAMSILAGPIGWVITGLWTAVDLAGPAYRITIPCVHSSCCAATEISI